MPAIKSGAAPVGLIQVELRGTNFTIMRDVFKTAETASYVILSKNNWSSSCSL